MELRRYGTILRRRWLLIVIPALVVGALAFFTRPAPPPPTYNVGANFLVSQEPGPEVTNTDENRYYNWLASEYIVNGLTDWAISSEFKTAVSTQLGQQGIDIPPGAYSVAADNVRSKLQLSLNYSHPDPETAVANLTALMNAATTVLSEQNAAVLPQLGGETAVIVRLDEPVVNAIPAGIRSQLDLLLRLGLAVATGIGLALLVEYLDPTIRDRRETEAAGLTVIGEIPKS